MATCGGPGSEMMLWTFYGDPPDKFKDVATRHETHNKRVMQALTKFGKTHRRLGATTQTIIEGATFSTPAAIEALSVCENQGRAAEILAEITRQDYDHYTLSSSVRAMANLDAEYAVPVLTDLATDPQIDLRHRGAACQCLGYHGAVSALCDYAETVGDYHVSSGVRRLPDPPSDVLDEWKHRGNMPEAIRDAVPPQHEGLPSLARHIRNKGTPDDAREWAVGLARQTVKSFNPHAWHVTYEKLPRMIADGEQSLARLNKAQERGYPVDDVIAELEGKVSTLRRRYSGMRAHREREE
jgi:hypothetical protein